MEFFPGRAHVRLRSRVHGTYLHADGDGLSRLMVLWRTIAYVLGDDHGNFDPHPLDRRRFIFYGRSVFQLTGILSILLRERFFGIRLCVWAGSQGRLTPLVIDLPANEQTMDLVVFTTATGSSAAQELVYPDVDA